MDYTISKNLKIGHYEITAEIGSGGMGEVWLAKDTELNRDVAIKFLPVNLCRDENYRARFQREAQATARLNHPNIVTIHEVGEYNTRPYLVMEYCKGNSIQELIANEPFDFDTTINIIRQIAGGLIIAHQSGVIHRDLKPSNILIDSDNQVKILDFGLAILQDAEQLTKENCALGTLGYISPEQLRNEPTDNRSDLFSLGVVFYEMLTGKNPFMADYTASTIYSILHDQPEPVKNIVPDIPQKTQEILNKALNKNPDERYQSAEEFYEDISNDINLPLNNEYSGLNSYLPGIIHKGKIKKKSLVITSFVIILISAFFLSPAIRNNVLSVIRSHGHSNEVHLAVIPFNNLGISLQDRAICDGLVETITSKLTQLEQFHGSLMVIPANMIREKEITSVQKARKTFGATLAITGSVQNYHDDVRLTLNLVDTKSERQLQSVVIDNVFSHISSLQDSSVIELAEMLKIQLESDDREFLAKGGTSSVEANRLYIKGVGFLYYKERPGNIDSAVVSFQSALNKDPHFALAYAGLGKAYWYLYVRDTLPMWEDLAIYNSQRSIDENDMIPQVYLTLGLIHDGVGRYKEALNDYKRAIEIDSSNFDAYCGLSKAYEALNRPEQAENAIKRAIRIRPDYWLGYYRLGSFYVEKGNIENAVDQIEKAVVLDQLGYDALNNLGALYHRVGLISKAQEMWNHSIQIEPNYAALSNLGSTYHIQQKYSEAINYYKRALKIDSNNYRIMYNMGLAMNELGLKDSASEVFNKAAKMAEKQRKINPNDPTILSELSGCYIELGKYDKALSLLASAMNMDPDNINIKVDAGIAFERAGYRDSALALLNTAVNQGFPRDQLSLYPELDNLLKDKNYIGNK